MSVIQEIEKIVKLCGESKVTILEKRFGNKLSIFKNTYDIKLSDELTNLISSDFDNYHWQLTSSYMERPYFSTSIITSQLLSCMNSKIRQLIIDETLKTL